jgi:hypothetical protein
VQQLAEQGLSTCISDRFDLLAMSLKPKQTLTPHLLSMLEARRIGKGIHIVLPRFMTA